MKNNRTWQVPTVVVEGILPFTEFEIWEDKRQMIATSYVIQHPVNYQALLTVEGDLIDIKTTDVNFPKHALTPDGKRLLENIIKDTGYRVG